jgi:ketosteroid isomerase-like protein
MIRPILILVLAAILPAAALPAVNAAPAAADSAAAEAAILQVLRDAEAGWNAGDIPAYMASYWKSPDLRFASGGSVTRGWQPTLARYLARYPDRETMGTLAFGDLDVRLLGPDHALVFGSWRLQRAADSPHGLFSLVLRRLPEGWRIVHDHTSSADE